MAGRTVVELTRELVRFDTTNPPGNEEAAMRCLAAFLEEAGITSHLDEAAPGRPNLIARVPGTGARGGLVLSGHMDVVPPGDASSWRHAPFAAEIEGGRIYGRGSADMKGGLAAMAVALVRLAGRADQLGGDVILAATVSEERDGLGSKRMADARSLEGSDYLIVGEPPDLNVCVAQKGVRRWNLTVHGRSAHSSTPELGISAVAYAARLVQALEDNPFPFEAHPFLTDPTVSVTGIDSWGAPNVIPATCKLQVMMRTVPGQDGAELDRRLDEVLAEVAARSGLAVQVDVELMGGGPGLSTPPDHTLPTAVAAAVRAATGREPRLLGFTGATDAANLVPAFDLPFVICGPGGLDVAHTVDEWVQIADLEAAVDVYVGAAERLLGGTEGES